MKNERVKTIVDEFTKNDEVVAMPAAIEVEKPNPVLGKVDTTELNVRETPVVDATNILGTVKKGIEVEIEMDESTDDFYKVYTATGLEGFCMKQFIRVEP